MKKLTVLITATGSPYSLGLIDCLKNNFEKREIDIICTDMIQQPLIHLKADKFYLLPSGNSKNYITSLLKICNKNKVDVIIPKHILELSSISKNLDLFQSHGIFPTISNNNSIKKTVDKFEVYELLKKNKISVPDYFLINNKKQYLESLKKLGYPKKTVCFKPSKQSFSGGARGFRILRKSNSIHDILLRQKPGTKEIDYETTLRLFDHKDLDLLLMEYVSGIHYSVHVFAENGKMKYCVPIKAKRKDHAYISEGTIHQNKKLESISKKLVKLFNFHSNVNFQFAFQKNTPKLIEINPRMSASINFSNYAGINLPYLAVKQALGETLPKKNITYGAKMIRYGTSIFYK